MKNLLELLGLIFLLNKYHWRRKLSPKYLKTFWTIWKKVKIAFIKIKPSIVYNTISLLFFPLKIQSKKKFFWILRGIMIFLTNISENKTESKMISNSKSFQGVLKKRDGELSWLETFLINTPRSKCLVLLTGISKINSTFFTCLLIFSTIAMLVMHSSILSL